MTIFGAATCAAGAGGDCAKALGARLMLNARTIIAARILIRLSQRLSVFARWLLASLAASWRLASRREP
jgi:hypothetical protein